MAGVSGWIRLVVVGSHVDDEIRTRLQRFISQERMLWDQDITPMLFAGGEGHPYAYVGNDPVNWIDFSGFARGRRGPGEPKPPGKQPPPPKRDDYTETQGQPDPIPPPPINPGTGCSKVFALWWACVFFRN